MTPREVATPGRLRRLIGRPGLLGTVLVIATLGVATALAYEAVHSTASHRKAVEAALDHHATTVAWQFARAGRGWLEWGMSKAGVALRSEVANHRELPGPMILAHVLEEKYCDCMTAAFAHGFVRLIPNKAATLELEGEPLSLRARDELRTLLMDFATVDSTLGTPQRPWRILPPGTPRLNRGSDAVLLWRIDGPNGRVRAVYGMIVERAQLERPLTGAMEETQFFPSQVVPKSVAPSLMRIEVAASNGVRLFTAGPDTRQYSGTDTLGRDFGGLVAFAAINPAAADVLVAGGVPPSRLPLIGALFVLAIAMGGSAALIRRREQRLARLREDFVSGVSHELRTPLTQIRMLSELLETEGFHSPEERGRAIGIIHRESLRLTNLVDNILEFSRLRRSNGAAPVARVALADVLREVAESFGPLLASAGNRIEVIAPEEITVRGDRDAVTRVVRNLVENAAKYGPPSQTIRLTLSRAEPAGARVIVDDEGPGIPPHERHRIWQPYYRLDRDRNAAGGGSGLGLSVVADLVQQLGGAVSVDDAPGRGARFTVDLPDVA